MLLRNWSDLAAQLGSGIEGYSQQQFRDSFPLLMPSFDMLENFCVSLAMPLAPLGAADLNTRLFCLWCVMFSFSSVECVFVLWVRCNCHAIACLPSYLRFETSYAFQCKTFRATGNFCLAASGSFNQNLQAQ